MTVEDCLLRNYLVVRSTRGFAWAARRALLAEHGIYDASVIGGGDALLARAAFGFWKHGARRVHMGPAWTDHFRAWAEPFHESVQGSVGYVPGDLIHLWHGSFVDRRYGERYADFSGFEFNPVEDIALDRDGAWGWNSAKADMHAFLGAYFKGRREDG